MLKPICRSYLKGRAEPRSNLCSDRTSKEEYAESCSNPYAYHTSKEKHCGHASNMHHQCRLYLKGILDGVVLKPVFRPYPKARLELYAHDTVDSCSVIYSPPPSSHHRRYRTASPLTPTPTPLPHHAVTYPPLPPPASLSQRISVSAMETTQQVANELMNPVPVFQECSITDSARS